jgi:hypothetical protein
MSLGPDQRIRELLRQAGEGDPQAARQAGVELLRQGFIPYPSDLRGYDNYTRLEELKSIIKRYGLGVATPVLEIAFETCRKQKVIQLLKHIAELGGRSAVFLLGKALWVTRQNWADPKALWQHLNDRSDIQQEAVRLLGEQPKHLRSQATSELISLINSFKDELDYNARANRVAAVAIYTVGELGNRAAVPYLLRFAGESFRGEHQKRNALNALTKFKRIAGVIPAMIDLWEKGDNWRVRRGDVTEGFGRDVKQTVLLLFETHARTKNQKKMVVDLLFKALWKEGHPWAARNIINTIHKLGDITAVPRLIEAAYEFEFNEWYNTEWAYASYDKSASRKCIRYAYLLSGEDPAYSFLRVLIENAGNYSAVARALGTNRHRVNRLIEDQGYEDIVYLLRNAENQNWLWEGKLRLIL